MGNDRAALAALVGSRLCHDLISPIGAIQNGLELVTLSGGNTAAGPEMALIQDSCDNASARIRFFRIAFGAAGEGQALAASEIRATFEALTRTGRITADWQIADRVPRHEVQLAFLAYLCAESALPLGGTITMARRDGGIRTEATGPRIKVEPDCWAFLTGDGTLAQVNAAQVQFALLATLAGDRSVPVAARAEADGVMLHVGAQAG